MPMAPSHDHSHHHHRSSNILVKVGQALHLPGFSHDHSHHDLAADRAFLDNRLAVRTVWIALIALGLTTALQIVIYIASGSVALLADTVHNLGDALNSIPLLFAFYIARRAANRRYTYGYGRLEDIAGVFIVISIGFSASYILYESIQRLLNPLPLENLEWIALAALVGFVGNELVALMQIRVGRRIGSDAMIADGQHALIDGLTSLAVLIAVVGTLIGVPILDPVVGIVIAIAIVGITWNAIKAIWYRMMDAVDPHLVEHLEQHVQAVDGVESVQTLRLRWVGHRMYGVLQLRVAATYDLGAGSADCACRAKRGAPGHPAVGGADRADRVSRLAALDSQRDVRPQKRSQRLRFLFDQRDLPGIQHLEGLDDNPPPRAAFLQLPVRHRPTADDDAGADHAAAGMHALGISRRNHEVPAAIRQQVIVITRQEARAAFTLAKIDLLPSLPQHQHSADRRLHLFGLRGDGVECGLAGSRAQSRPTAEVILARRSIRL